jgi:integrase
VYQKCNSQEKLKYPDFYQEYMSAPAIQIHNRSVETRKGLVQSDWQIPPEEKKQLVRFLEELELGKVNRGRKITASRQAKYLDVLRAPLEFFHKCSTSLTLKDVEQFEKALTSGSLLSNRGEPYSSATKVDMRRALKVYLRWRLGAAKSNKLTGWLDTRDVVKSHDYLREDEVEKLYKHCKSAEERFLIAVLFDSGARATEFHNIRVEDVHLPEKGESFPRITLKEEYSKTKGRTVSLYWKYSLEAASEYLKERRTDLLRSDEPVFAGTYQSARFFLIRLGRKLLKKSIHYHLFRHSSATHYATKLNRQQLCYRYGWAFSSRMPDIYISRSGMQNAELDEKFTHTELSSLKDDFLKLQQTTKIKDDRIAGLENAITELRSNVQMITEILQQNPSVAAVEAALRKRTGRAVVTS